MLKSPLTMSFLTSKRFTFTWTLIKGYILDSNIRIEVTWTMLYVTEERTIRLPLQTFLLYYLVDTLNQKLFFPNQDIFSQDIPISNSIKQKLLFQEWKLLVLVTGWYHNPWGTHQAEPQFHRTGGVKKVFLSGQVDWKKWTFDQAFLNNLFKIFIKIT